MILLVTGGCGFLGSNLAKYAAETKQWKVLVFDNLSRVGSERNKDWLLQSENVRFIQGDVRIQKQVDEIFQQYPIDAVFHLAGQVAMTTSIENPRLDFETNALGTFNVLDAIRRFRPEAKMTYASTNKVYGDLEQYSYEETPKRYICTDFPNGYPETVPLSFHSPYGTSKGAADQYVLDAARIFGLNTVVFRHSSMYGGRQFATYDQGWIGWFCAKALEQKHQKSGQPFTISGNGKQVRDILHINDLVKLYFNVLEHFSNVKGRVYNIGGGIENALSLLELFDILEDLLKVRMQYTQLSARASDQRVFVADISAIREATGWYPEVSAKAGISAMIDWVNEAQK